MMGEQTVMQEALFYEFSIERHVPANHLLRSIDRFVDLSGLRTHLRPFYSEIGRPFDRSGTDDPDADRRLLLRHSIGAAAVRRGASEPRLSVDSLGGHQVSTHLSGPPIDRRASGRVHASLRARRPTTPADRMG